MRIAPRSGPLAVLAVAGMLLGTTGTPVCARGQSPPLVGFSGTNALADMQARVSESAMQGNALVLEGAVDPHTYIVGPGDRFSVGIGGLLTNAIIQTVSASGFLDLPEAGQIQAAGRSLADVLTAALAALEQQHSNVSVSVSLAQTRSFYVHVSGSVPQPGRYLMLPISRVDEVLALAFTPKYYDAGKNEYVYSPARRPAMQFAYHAAFRNIEVIHRDGSRNDIDLVRYYNLGDLGHNPYLRDGDRIVVPSYHAVRDGIRVSGDVAYPGTYDLRPDDTASDLLELAGGPEGVAQMDSVHLVRHNGSETLYLDARRVFSGESDDPLLAKGDHLLVAVPEAANANIRGQIRYPGWYRIESGKTTLSQLIAMAGGLKPDANLNAAVLERFRMPEVRQSPQSGDLDELLETFIEKAGGIEPDDDLNEEGFERERPPDDRESRQLSDLGFFSREFAESFNREEYYHVRVDIASAVGSSDTSTVLYNGDRLIIPRDEQTVQVTGQVPRPSFVALEEGKPASYYVDLVGGAGPGSRNIYVFRGTTGEISRGGSVIVRSGDTVFVDRKGIAETVETQQLLIDQQRNNIQTVQAIVAGVSAITGVVATYVALFSRN